MPKSSLDSKSYLRWADYHNKPRRLYRLTPNMGKYYFGNYVKPNWYPHFRQFSEFHRTYFDSNPQYKHLRYWRYYKKSAKDELAASHQYDWGPSYTKADIAREKQAAQDACWDCEDPYDPPVRYGRHRYTKSDLDRLRRLAADSQWEDTDPYAAPGRSG